MAEVEFVEEKMYTDAVVMDQTGKVLHNAMQQDCPVIRRRDTEGRYHVTRQDTGAYILPPYRPEEFEIDLRCHHCGERPW